MSDKLLVYTAQSKQHFYCRDAVCEFVFQQGAVPLNPFRAFDYFLGDRVHRDAVRKGNRRILAACDEVWIFGCVLADGVLIEIAQAKEYGKPVRYFTIDTRAETISEVGLTYLDVEHEVLEMTGLDRPALLQRLHYGAAEEIVQAMGRMKELSSVS